jgi:novobiocin biosynthesis protein NovU/D-mycarose 3-C-methyltransferase
MKKCYFCESTNVETIFYIEDCPIAGNFLEKPEDDILLPLDILICKDCGIAQLDKSCFVPKENLFKKYFYKTHSINTLKTFFYKQADELNAFTSKKLSVLEIGGNSCPLGERMVGYGHAFINVDPSDTALYNTPKDVYLVNDFFDEQLASKIKKTNGVMDIIYSANNFANMEDLNSVVKGIQTLLSEDGKLIIQVQDFEYLLEDLCFPFFYHEHLFYYTSYTLANLLSKYGFKLVDCSKNSIHGGSINCVFKKTNEEVVVDLCLDKLEEKLRIFISKIEMAKEEIYNFLDTALSLEKKVIAYGASGQANILFAKFDITDKHIPYIVDDAPLKLGKFTPYSHIEIKGSEFIDIYKPDYIFVTAYNFINEIKGRTINYKGKWIVPLPNLKEI